MAQCNIPLRFCITLSGKEICHNFWNFTRFFTSEVFQRDENNIYVVFPITYSQAVLGDTITVPSIDGKVEVNVPEGTQSGTTFRLRGKGVQYVNGRGRGDMYVKCEVEIPKKLSRTQREALKKFEGTLKEDNYEKRKGFFKKLKDMFNN